MRLASLRLRLRGTRSGQTTRAAVAPTVDDDDDDDDADDLGDLGEMSAERVRPAPGPVPLVLTTREEIEKATARPPVVRRRLERGAYGGTAGGHGPGCAC